MLTSQVRAQPPRKPRQLSASDTSTLSLASFTNDKSEITINLVGNSHGQQLAMQQNEDRRRHYQQYYWIVTHFRSGSTLLSTMLSLPQENTIFLYVFGDSLDYSQLIKCYT